MDAHDAATREVLDTAAQWARDRAETRAVLGAVLDSIAGHLADGHAVALLNPQVVADLKRRADS